MDGNDIATNNQYASTGSQQVNLAEQGDNTFGFQPTESNQSPEKIIYKLTLTRPKAFVGSAIKYKIYIDNYEVGTIKNGETVVLSVYAGSHVISFNKTMEQNININDNITADVVVIAARKFGLSNVRNSKGESIQNGEISKGNAEKIIKSAKWPLIFSCACIVISAILIFAVKMVVSPWVFGLSLGYSIVNLLSITKNKQILGQKYNFSITMNIISMAVSVIGAIGSIFLTTW